jgi:hypothetical protein
LTTPSERSRATMRTMPDRPAPDGGGKEHAPV